MHFDCFISVIVFQLIFNQLCETSTRFNFCQGGYTRTRHDTLLCSNKFILFIHQRKQHITTNGRAYIMDSYTSIFVSIYLSDQWAFCGYFQIYSTDEIIEYDMLLKSSCLQWYWVCIVPVSSFPTSLLRPYLKRCNVVLYMYIHQIYMQLVLLIFVKIKMTAN